MPRVHLHRVVPGVPSRWIGLTTPSKGILPAHQGRTPPWPARCSRLRGRLTRATTDSHREARPARAASGASTLHQPLRPLRAGLPLGPSPHDAAPTPSLSQWRSELRRPDGGREGLASFVGARIARNGRDQRLATNELSTPPDFVASPLHRFVRLIAQPRIQTTHRAHPCRCLVAQEPQDCRTRCSRSRRRTQR